MREATGSATEHLQDIRVKRDKLGGIVGRKAPHYPALSWFPIYKLLCLVISFNNFVIIRVWGRFFDTLLGKVGFGQPRFSWSLTIVIPFLVLITLVSN